MKFKKGDRIIGIGCYDGKNIEGLKGTIISDKRLSSQFPVEFDKDINGHTCGRSGKPGHCLWVPANHLRLDCNKTIVIYCKDNEVIALDKSTGNKGIARCCPDDTFDFEIGAKLAFERLIEAQRPEEKKPLNTKICITSIGEHTSGRLNDLTIGKIYEVKDGKFTTDNGDRYPLSDSFYDIEELVKYLGGSGAGTRYALRSVHFVEVVE